MRWAGILTPSLFLLSCFADPSGGPNGEDSTDTATSDESSDGQGGDDESGDDGDTGSNDGTGEDASGDSGADDSDPGSDSGTGGETGDIGTDDGTGTGDIGTGDSGTGDDTGTGDSGTGDSGTDTDTEMVEVLAPNGDELWKPGEQHTVSWTSDTLGTVDVFLEDDGVNIATLATDQGATGSFDWTIPATVPNSGLLRVVVTTESGSSDESDGPFTVAAWRYYTTLEATNLTAMVRTDHPMVVELTPANFDYAHARPDGADLRVSTSAEQASGFDVPHWVQEWNPGGSSWVWFNVASLPASTTTSFYMFHDNSVVTSPGTDFAGVFPNRYVSAGDELLVVDHTVQVDLFHVRGGDTVTVTNSLAVFASAVFIEGTLTGLGRGPSGGDGSGPGDACTGCGGGGAGHGGVGGQGALDGGETGGAGGVTYGAADTFVFNTPDPGSGGGAGTNGGGSGGGSIALQGSARVFVGMDGVIDVRGGGGANGTNGSGGGSGGTVVLLGNNINVAGVIRATGGKGGDATNDTGNAGGGGGGGRVGLHHTEPLVPATPTLELTGGAAGTGGAGALADPGADGNVTNDTVTINSSAAVGAEVSVF